MIAIFALAGWAVVGLIVAAIEKSIHREPEVDATMLTVLCVAGALAGAFVGQTFRLFVFGQPAGFLFAAAGAKLLLELYRSRRPVVRSADQPAASVIAPPTLAPSPALPEIPLGKRLGDAFGYGIACAVAVGIAGFLGHLAGSFVYPQKYEQIPSDFVFVPLGLILGFVAGATSSLARPQWRTQMIGVMILASIGYAAVMFEYARGRAIGAGFTVTFDPDPGVPVSCRTAACPQADPPLEWMVQGTLRVQEMNGLGATVDSISISSSDVPRPAQGSRRLTREEVVEQSKFDGPRVRLEGRELNGPRHIRAHDVVSYPINYFYRTRSGEPERNLDMYIAYTDDSRRASVRVVQWKVR